MKVRRKKHNRIGALLLALLLCLSLPACGKKESGLEKITFVLDWTPNTNHTGLYVAQDMGYYADEGLEVEIIQPPENGALSMVASGKAQFCVSFQEEIAPALTADQPLPVTAVAALLQHNTSGIISLKSTGIASPKDLEGKRYATWDSPLENSVMKNVVEMDGGDYSKVEKIPSTVTDVMTALQTDIDAVWVYYGWDGIAAKIAGLDVNFMAFRDLNPVFDFYTPLIAAGNNFLQQHPETAKKFLRATAKGYAYAMQYPNEAADLLVEYAPEITWELAARSQQYIGEQYQAQAAYWGEIDAGRWDAFYSWMNEAKLLPRAMQPGEGFTNEYLGKS